MIRVAVPVYNAERWIAGCLTSILAQTVRDCTVVAVNDASTDATGWILDSIAAADERLTVLHRPRNAGALANLVLAFAAQMPADDDICLTVDGDDRLLTPRAFELVSDAHAAGAKLTYGNFIQSNGHTSWVEPYPEHVKKGRAYRAWKWWATHLRTFRYRLWRHLTAADLVDPETGRTWSTAWDCAMMLPMLEMCRPEQVACIMTPLYWYNAGNPISDHRKDAEGQRRTGDRIFAMPQREMLPW